MKISSILTRVISLVLVLTFVCTNSIGYTNPSSFNFFEKSSDQKIASLARTLAAARSEGVVRDIKRSVGLEVEPAAVRSELRNEPSESESPKRAALERGHVIANQIMVSGHLALIPSLFSLAAGAKVTGLEVILFIFFSLDTIVSGVFWYLSYHVNVWWHERAHYWEAVRQLTLRKDLLEEAKEIEKLPLLNPKRLKWEIRMFLKAPYGKFPGIKFDSLSYYVDAPFNLAVAAAGPKASGKLAYVLLPISAALIAVGYIYVAEPLVMLGRLLLPIGAVALFDRLLADPGMLKKFNERERAAAEASAKVAAQETGDSWLSQVRAVKDRMIASRIQRVKRPDGTEITVPFGWRNSAMGGVHTEKEYPESNISMQESMFIPLSARSVEEAQEMTVALQNRLREIIESTAGSRVMGIGLEGGLAPYVTPDAGDVVPEQKLWRLMTQAIKDLGYVPGKDVVLALDVAASEMENAYREHVNPDAVGIYLFWRDKAQVKMTREELNELYRKTLEEGIPIVSIEDGFSERDDEGFDLFNQQFGDKLFRVGDDLVTTNDRVIEEKAMKGLLNVLLTKYNQIGTISETNLAMITALAYGLELIISHRSKSPNDDGEAQIAMAVFSLGSKFGGGANTERLVKYQAFLKKVREAIGEASTKTGASAAKVISDDEVNRIISQLEITDVTAYEEPTNAGIPTVGVEVIVGIKGHPQYEKLLRFTGATPLGTSAGTGEAIHLVDTTIEKSDITVRYPDLFKKQDDLTYKFAKTVNDDVIASKNDAALTDLWKQTKRYGGKGVLNAAANVTEIVKPLILGKKASDFENLAAIDRLLLQTEVATAQKRGKDVSDPIAVAQRKGNLGMNAILSLSLALGRFKAAAEGMDFFELERREVVETIAKIVGESESVDWRTLTSVKSWDDWNALIKRLVDANLKLRAQGKNFYPVARRHLPVYDFPAARSELRSIVTKVLRTSALAGFALSSALSQSAPVAAAQWNAAVAPIREAVTQAVSVPASQQLKTLADFGIITSHPTNVNAQYGFVFTRSIVFDDSLALILGPVAQSLPDNAQLFVIAPTAQDQRIVSEINAASGTHIRALPDYQSVRSELRRAGLVGTVIASETDSTSVLAQYFDQVVTWGRSKISALFSLYNVAESLVTRFQARLAVLRAA